MMTNLRGLLTIAAGLGFAATAGAVSFTCVQPGPTTWVYTLTFAAEDNMNVTQSTTTITVNGLSGVTAATGPTSTDFPVAPFSSGTGSTAQIAPPAILNWTAQVKNNGTTVVWSIINVGTGNFSSVHSVFGFSITASASNGTAALVTSGFSRDTPNPLPGGGLGIDISGNVQGPAATTSVVLPQLVFGGGWYSAVYFTNTGPTNASFNVKYTTDNGAPMVIPSTGTSSIPMILGPGGTGIVETPNTGVFTQGYATANLPPGVQGYGVLRQSIPGIADQEAVVPLSLASNIAETLIFDETNFVTGVAIANPTGVTVTITVTALNTSGAVIGNSTLALAPFTHTATALRSLPGMSAMAGQRGQVTFAVSNGNVATLGLRFNGSAFTSIPAVGR